MPDYRKWTADEIALLGTMRDDLAAKQIGCHIITVIRKRQRLGIASWYKTPIRKKARAKAWNDRIGVVDWGKIDWSLRDAEIARQTGRTRQRVDQARAEYAPETKR